MPKRSAFITGVNWAALAAMECGVAEKFGMGTPKKYHDMMIYPALLQSGVSFFVSPPQEIIANKHAEFNKIKGKLVTYKSAENFYLETKKLSDAIEGSCLREASKEELNTLNLLAIYLTEIKTCIQTNSSLVLTLPHPDPDILHGLLALETIQALKLFRDCIEDVQTTSPVPQTLVSGDAVAVFMEIMDSQPFAQYESSHMELELSEDPTSTTLGKISDKANILTKKFDGLLDVKETSLKILKVSDPVLDLVGFGSASPVTKILSFLIELLLRKNKNLVIYDYRKVHLEMLIRHYQKKTNDNHGNAHSNSRKAAPI
ncbi:hypothetical protein LCGC14_1140710 [marine sediment metagenome]|uniref:Uncharacterized protein n=1 Tax=marine sediment metagenome TaxID=412755 RepID=A0A0F9M352_9ZZZZ